MVQSSKYSYSFCLHSTLDDQVSLSCIAVYIEKQKLSAPTQKYSQILMICVYVGWGARQELRLEMERRKYQWEQYLQLPLSSLWSGKWKIASGAVSGSPRLPLRFDDSPQNPEKLLYSRLWFITVKQYRLTSAKEKCT